jgi:hypothetical protein
VKQLVNLASKSIELEKKFKIFKGALSRLEELRIDIRTSSTVGVSEDLWNSIIQLKDVHDASRAWELWLENQASVWERRKIAWTTRKGEEKTDVALSKKDELTIEKLAEWLAPSVLDELMDEMRLTDREREYMVSVLAAEEKNPTEKYKECTWIFYVSKEGEIEQTMEELKREWKGFDRSQIIDKFCTQYSMLWKLVSNADFHGSDTKGLPEFCALDSEDYEKYVVNIAGNNKYKEDVARALVKMCPKTDTRGTAP